MAKGQTVRLVGESQRKHAHELIEKAPANAVVNIQEAKRSNAQNDKMWAMLSDISKAKPEGRHLTTDLWKCAFMSSCGHEVQFMNGLDDGPPFPVGFKTSHLKVAQMAELIEFIYAYGARHNVVWTEPEITNERAA